MVSLKGLFLSAKTKLQEIDGKINFTCDVCGSEVFSDEHICFRCRNSLPYNNGFICPYCGRRVLEEGACIECKQKPLTVKKARSVFVHSDEAARLVIRYKSGEKYLYKALAEAMLPLIRSEFADDTMIIGVPMTEGAVKKRGYNQSTFLAKELAKRLSLEYGEPAQKTRETEAQKRLNRREREENLKGCFHVKDRKGVRGKRILIVDDTLTTGSTASALADVLLRAGAANVDLVTATSVPISIVPKEDSIS